MSNAAYAYPKRFRFTGLIELTYRDYSFASSYYGHGTDTSYTSFEQRYMLGLRGYIYHPKLVSFYASLTYRKEIADDGSDNNRDLDTINYNFSANILRTNPISLDLYALKTDSTIEGWGTSPYNITTSFFGARLRFTRRNFPSIVIGYDHWEYTIEREHGFLINKYGFGELIIEKKIKEENTENTRFNININGFLKTINTRYNIIGDLSEYSSPFREYDGKNIIANTYTNIKNQNSLSTSFQHSDIDIKKLTMFTADLRLSPIGKLNHNYGYEYLTFETEDEKADLQTVSSYLLYRLSKMIFGTANLRYSFGNRNERNEESYGVNIGLNYGKLIKNFDFTSYYKFSIKTDESRGEYKFVGNSLGIGLSTRKFKLGKIYANYDISTSKYDYNYTLKESEYYYSEFEEFGKLSAEGDYIEHRVRTGINGKGPRRAYWNIEAEARIFDANTKNHGTTFWIGEEQWAEKIRHYTLTGDIGYPIGQKGLATLKGSYTTGETNSENIESYYYEVRLNYRILRNLNFLGWWREDWRNQGWWAGSTVDFQRKYGWKNREYQLELRYLIRSITLSLEYNVYRLEEGPLVSEYKRFYVKLSKPF
ncbi:MAG: hypothetical protein HXY53_01045 [Nitrospirae bacterium]|nr:hypothetical protein [Nitrospirota bacterium]